MFLSLYINNNIPLLTYHNMILLMRLWLLKLIAFEMLSFGHST